ncbi:MAG: prepilin-type N-terminal cleavage/methylation domain-containing protein [Lacunisphaera sp.]|nr:prepilin-type N-terminal cleavage/methylation domain-containing protein [Lacunisphaera sp.]
MRSQLRNQATGFTLVEVMMAATILVVGFMGMIQAVTIGSEMLASARRQTLAAQIISHELEKLRYVAWTNGSTGINEPGPTTLTIDSQFTSAITAAGLVTDYSVATNPYIQLQRSVADVVSGSMREVTFTVTWQKSGTTAAANAATGSWLEQLSFNASAPIRRTYTRSGCAYFSKYGLGLSYQRS